MSPPLSGPEAPPAHPSASVAGTAEPLPPAQRDLLEGLLARFEGTEAEGDPVKMLALRGWAPDAQSEDLGIWSDAIALCEERSARRHWLVARASTAPNAYWVRNPMNRRAGRRLQEGLWWLKPGVFLRKDLPPVQGGRDAWGRVRFADRRPRPASAFVLAEPALVDHENWAGQVVASSQIDHGLALHGETRAEWGRFGFGDQVVRSEDGPWGEAWKDFHFATATALARHGMSQFPYMVVGWRE